MRTAPAGIARTDEARPKKEIMDAAYVMADHMGLNTSLDGPDSPGSVWLRQLRDMVSEAWEGGRFADDSGEDEQDLISGLADSVVPIFTHQRWAVFVDLCAYSDEVTEDLDTYGDPTEWAGAVLMYMAERAMYSWVQYRRLTSRAR